MDSKRQGEIALLLVKALARREGSERLLGHISKLNKISEVTGIKLDELRTFTEILVKDLVKEFFAEKAK